MTTIKQTKTNFTAGEVSRQLLGRGDLRAYENGALELKNMFIYPTGGVTRRAGSVLVNEARGKGRLVPFEFNADQVYLLVFTHNYVEVYKNDVQVAGFFTLWSESMLPQISWTQSADTLIVCHPDLQPKTIKRVSDASWTLANFTFDTESGAWTQPYYKFVDNSISITPSGTTGTITLTASSGIFTAEHHNARIRINGGEVRINSFISSTVVQAAVHKPLTTNASTTEWKEAAFSNARGWPCAAAFHQDRLVFGGSRDLPNRLWFSKTGSIFNFEVGSGNDDEAIEFSILSDQVNQIVSIYSGRHLQVFTSGAEWMVTGDPLTPQSIQIKRQTKVGSMPDRNIDTVNVDGATLFAARNGKELREFIYTDLEAAYKATDLSLVAEHIINNPVDMTFDSHNRLLFVVMEDGSLSVLTVYRDEAVAAWTSHDTQGSFLSVLAIGGSVYALVEREHVVTIEYFTTEYKMDCCLISEEETATATHGGFLYHAELEVEVFADGVYVGTKTVNSEGEIFLDTAAETVVAGLSYTHRICPLPPSMMSEIGYAGAVRPVQIRFRLDKTVSLRVDTGQGFYDYLAAEQEAGSVFEKISGDRVVGALGWRKDLSEPLWEIEESKPADFTLLSVTTEMKVND